MIPSGEEITPVWSTRTEAFLSLSSAYLQQFCRSSICWDSRESVEFEWADICSSGALLVPIGLFGFGKQMNGRCLKSDNWIADTWHCTGWTTYPSVSGLHRLHPWRNAEGSLFLLEAIYLMPNIHLRPRRIISLVPEMPLCTTGQMGARVHGKRRTSS